MANHKELKVWKDAMSLSKEIYFLTKKFPKEELYCMTSQLRRCAISVPSNIAEGAARSGDKEFIQFLYISNGSLSEMETQILLAQDVGLLHDVSILYSIETVRKEIAGLIRYLRNKKQ